MLLLLPLLSGCIGGLFVYPKKIPVGEYKRYAKCAELIASWGQPDHQSVDGSATTLVYKMGYKWAGVMPMIIIPIPLVIPVGRNSTSLVCEDGVLIGASGTEIGLLDTETDYVGGYCGWINIIKFVGNEPSWGCKTNKF
jgi:hypothetical protein